MEVLSEIPYSIMCGINVTLFENNTVVTIVEHESPGYTF